MCQFEFYWLLFSQGIYSMEKSLERRYYPYKKSIKIQVVWQNQRRYNNIYIFKILNNSVQTLEI